MAITYSVASDIANVVLDFFVKGDALAQTIQDKPLLRSLVANQKEFPAGKTNVDSPVQGAFMSDTSGFFAGFSHAETLVFTKAENVLRAYYPWKEVHAGLVISFTELKKEGITVVDDREQSTREHPGREQVLKLKGLLENRMSDFMESWSEEKNEMLWKDGTQDSEQVAGILSLLPDDPTTGTVGGLSRATYSWWRHRALVGASKITASAANQTLSKTLRTELRQLRRFRGRPDVALAGSGFLEALELEVSEKGIYTDEGFENRGKTGIGVADIHMRGLGTFQYDPTLDDLGLSKRCYVLDSRRVKLRPMTGEADRMLVPPRPAEQLVFLRSMTWTGALEMTQANSNGVYEVA